MSDDGIWNGLFGKLEVEMTIEEVRARHGYIVAVTFTGMGPDGTPMRTECRDQSSYDQFSRQVREEKRVGWWSSLIDDNGKEVEIPAAFVGGFFDCEVFFDRGLGRWRCLKWNVRRAS